MSVMHYVFHSCQRKQKYKNIKFRAMNFFWCLDNEHWWTKRKLL